MSLAIILSVQFKNSSIPERAKVKYLDTSQNKIISDYKKGKSQSNEFAVAHKLAEIENSKPSKVYLILEEANINPLFIVSLYDSQVSNELSGILISVGDDTPSYVTKSGHMFKTHGFLQLDNLTIKIQPLSKGKNKTHIIFFQGEKSYAGY